MWVPGTRPAPLELLSKRFNQTKKQNETHPDVLALDLIQWEVAQSSMKNELTFCKVKVEQGVVCARARARVCVCVCVFVLVGWSEVTPLGSAQRMLSVSPLAWRWLISLWVGNGGGPDEIPLSLAFFLLKFLTHPHVRPFSGSYVPRCTDEGYFKPTQCHSSTSKCWCVDKYGNEIVGSRKEGNPNCGRTATLTKACTKRCKETMESAASPVVITELRLVKYLLA